MLVKMGITADATVALHIDNQAARKMMAKPFGTKMRKFIELCHRLLQESTA